MFSAGQQGEAGRSGRRWGDGGGSGVAAAALEGPGAAAVRSCTPLTLFRKARGPPLPMLGRPKGVLQVPSLWQKSANSEDVCELLCAKATSGTSRQDKRLVRPDVLWAGSCWATLHRDPQVLPSPPDDAPFERADMARRPQRLLPLLAAAALSLALACTDQELEIDRPISTVRPRAAASPQPQPSSTTVQPPHSLATGPPRPRWWPWRGRGRAPTSSPVTGDGDPPPRRPPTHPPVRLLIIDCRRSRPPAQ